MPKSIVRKYKNNTFRHERRHSTRHQKETIDWSESAGFDKELQLSATENSRRGKIPSRKRNTTSTERTPQTYWIEVNVIKNA